MKLRPYQEKAISGITKALDKHSRALVVMPTGTGKTIVFADYINTLRKSGQVTDLRPAIMLAHRDELLGQASSKLQAQDEWMRIGKEMAEHRAPGGCEVICASVLTVGRPNARLANTRPSVVIVDEAHHVAAKSYQTALNKWGAFEGRCKVIGFTATPHRMDNRRLEGKEGTFQTVAFTYTVTEAIDDGYLCDLRGFRIRSDVDLDSIGTVGGDFNEGQLAAAVGTQERTSMGIHRWIKHAKDRQTIVFCVDVAHAEMTTEMFQSVGVNAAMVCGDKKKVSESQREGIINAFRAGAIQVLCNVDIATEGFDVPAVSCILLLRPTKSWARYCQMIGRGTRIDEGKEDCIILDVVDVTTKHALCTVPQFLDLPANLDLEGTSLKAAARMMAEVEETALGAAIRKSPTTVQELKTIIQQIDLLGTGRVPDMVKKHSSRRWIEGSGGGYLLSCGNDRALRLRQDAIGNWTLTAAYGRGQSKEYPSDTDSPERAFQAAERFIRKNWKDADSITRQEAFWAKQKVSLKQEAVLVRAGIDPKAIRQMTRGEASLMITRILTKA